MTRTIDFSALRAQVAHETCDCGKPAETFTANADEVRFVCFDCYVANRGREREKTRAAIRRLLATA